MRRWLIPISCIGLLSGAVQAQESAPPPPGGGNARAACKADYEKLCKGVQPGGGRIVACLREHMDELSPVCHDALAQGGAHHPPKGGEEGSSPPPASPPSGTPGKPPQ